MATAAVKNQTDCFFHSSYRVCRTQRRSVAEVCKKLVVAKLLTVRTGLHVKNVLQVLTRWPSELLLASSGYLPSDWPLDQQSQLICSVELG